MAPVTCLVTGSPGEFVDHVVELLSREGIATSVPWDQPVRPGEPISEAILRAIQGCAELTLILDVDIDIAYRRLLSRNDWMVRMYTPNELRDLLGKRREKYIEQYKGQEKVEWIDTNNSISEVGKEVIRVFRKHCST